MRRGPLGRWWRIGLIAGVLLAVLPAVAAAIGIALDRAPAPPQAIPRGGAEQVQYSITYGTVAERFRVTISDPSGNIVQDENVNVAGQPSPINGQRSFTPVFGAPLGRYKAQLDFFSIPGPTIESSAFVTFDVADQLGTLQLIKFEDVNGSGARDPGEPGVPNWTFRLVNPQGNGSVVRTGPDGSITIPNVPAGVWQVFEEMEPGWIPITPAAGTVTVPANGTGTFAAGNARPVPICGVVFLDANRNGRLDPGETGVGGAPLGLTGTRPNGTVDPRGTTSATDGSYCFPDLPPGTYTVTVTVPSGYAATTPTTIRNIGIVSGRGSANNNFGVAPPEAQPPLGPRPDVRIDKGGPATRNIGASFDYTIVVRNNSRFAARNVVVSDLVPLNLLLRAIPAGASVRNGVVTWEVGTLNAGASKRLTLPVRAAPGFVGRVNNVAVVTATGLPPRRDNARTRIIGPAPKPPTGGVTG